MHKRSFSCAPTLLLVMPPHLCRLLFLFPLAFLPLHHFIRLFFVRLLCGLLGFLALCCLLLLLFFPLLGLLARSLSSSWRGFDCSKTNTKKLSSLPPMSSLSPTSGMFDNDVWIPMHANLTNRRPQSSKCTQRHEHLQGRRHVLSGTRADCQHAAALARAALDGRMDMGARREE